MERLVRPVIYGFTQITVELQSWHWLTDTHAHTHAHKYTQVPANRLAAQLQLVYFGRKADDWLRMRDCVYEACTSHACTWQQLASVFVWVWCVCIVAVDLPHLTLTTLTSCVAARAMQFTLIQFDLICFCFVCEKCAQIVLQTFALPLQDCKWHISIGTRIM